MPCITHQSCAQFLLKFSCFITNLRYTLGLFANSRNIHLMNRISGIQLCPKSLTTFTKGWLFFGLNFLIDPTFLYEKKTEVMLHKTFISTHFALLGRSLFYSIWICMNIGDCHDDILHNHMIFVIRCCAYHIMTFKDTWPCISQPAMM